MDILEKLNSLKRGHRYCEDTWYSCPKHPEGCADDSQGDVCNCGADIFNERVDRIIEYLEQGNVRYKCKNCGEFYYTILESGLCVGCFEQHTAKIAG